MFNCPHCGKPALTVLRKTILGPGVPVSCQSCRQNIKITFPAWLKAAAPGTAVMVGALFCDSKPLIYGGELVGLGLMIGLHLLCVPLVKEQ